MAKRGLLSRHRQGRKVYVGLTDEADALLEDGHRRVEMGAVDQDWDGLWTWVAFSLPDDRRNERHDLRSRLVWAGFGPLQGGLWISPGRKDIAGVIGASDLDGRVHVLVGTADPADASEMIRSAFDVEGIADRYQSFLDRWQVEGADESPDELARQLLLHNDWLQLIRQDPRLPAQHLPADWPAIPAERLFRRLAAELGPRAATVAATIIETIPA
jgi:phenylacetic acid degradation operon negative regulatory protein